MKFVSKKLLVSVLVAFAALLTNQTTWAKEFNFATLTVVRQNSWVGSGTGAGVYLNSLKIGVVENDSQAKFTIPANGDYQTIKITSENDVKIGRFFNIDSSVASDERSILVSPGDNIFFEIEIGWNPLKYISRVRINP